MLSECVEMPQVPYIFTYITSTYDGLQVSAYNTQKFSSIPGTARTDYILLHPITFSF